MDDDGRAPGAPRGRRPRRPAARAGRYHGLTRSQPSTQWIRFRTALRSGDWSRIPARPWVRLGDAIAPIVPKARLAWVAVGGLREIVGSLAGLICAAKPRRSQPS